MEIDSYQQLVEFIKEKVAGLSSYLLIDEEWKFCGMYKISSEFSVIIILMNYIQTR